MIYALIFVILLNVSLSMAIYFKKRIEETLFLSIVGIILILFLSGIIVNFNIGYYFILFLNIPLMFYNIKSICKNRSIIKENLLTPSLLLLALSLIFLGWLNHGREFVVWDEFSHWALVVKNMFYFNDFGLGENSTVLAKSYLSGTSIFQYFCLKLNGVYNESILYFGQNLIVLSFILPIFKKIKKLNSITLWLSYLMIVLIPTIFYPYFYSSLYVDGILGIAFAYSIYSYYSNYDNALDKFNVVNLSASLMMLIFIKDFGIVLSLITAFIVLIDNVAIRNKFSLKCLWNKGKVILLAYIPAILVKVLWLLKLKSFVSSSSNSEGGMISHIINLFNEGLVGYKSTVFGSFIKALFFKELSSSTVLKISFAVGVCIFILLSYLLVHDMKKSSAKTSNIFSSISVVVGAIGYASLILIAYLTIFSDYESLRLASYERYIGTYILGMLIIILALLINKYSVNIKKNNIFIILSIGMLLFLTNYNVIINSTIYARADVATTRRIRKPYKKFKNITDKYLKEDDLLYFISTNDNGIDFYISRYELTPKKMNLAYGWSIGNPYDENDIWTIQKSKDQWKEELLQSYDYVYLFDIDEQFIENYKTLFKNKNDIVDNSLFKVVKNSNSNKILEIVSK